MITSAIGPGASAGLTTDPTPHQPNTRRRRRGLARWPDLAAAVMITVAACNPVVSPGPQSASPTSAAPTGGPSALRTSPPPDGVASEEPEPTAPASTDCGQVMAATAPQGGQPSRARALYQTEAGLFIYDVAANSSRQIDDESSPTGPPAQFRTSTLISVVRHREGPDDAHTFGQDSLFEYDAAAKRSTEILRLPDSLLAHDWSPDGAVLAYLLRFQTPTLLGSHLLCAFDSRTGTASLVRHIENPFGTGVGQREETAVTWSPDGGAILVTDTAAQPSLFVVTLDGRDIVGPRAATFGRWAAADRLILQETPQDGSADWEWLYLATQTGTTHGFGLPATAYRPAISPSGDQIAYDDGKAQPSVYVFNTAERTSERLATGYVAPIWIGPNTVAMTAADPCTAGDFCEVPWTAQETTGAVDLATGKTVALALPSTLSGVVRYGVIDIQLP